MLNFQIVLQISLLLLLLTACRPAVEPAAGAATTPQPATETAAPAPPATAAATPIPTATASPTVTPSPLPSATLPPTPTPHPASVEALRQRDFPGSELVIEQTLDPRTTYGRYLASYLSDGHKNFGLLTIPTEPPPESGWPAIVFNHGYIPPQQYRTGERYGAYVDAFARAGYVVFMPDYRGHGDSEGEPSAGYGSVEYTVDVLNALSSLKRHPDVDPARLGMLGHSMGGGLTLRSMVITPDIKAGVIWAGVVGPYGDIINTWTPPDHPAARAWRNGLLTEFGGAADDVPFWEAKSPNSYIDNITPIQLHHGTADSSVPPAFSETLADQLATAGREVEIYIYDGDDHNLSQNLSLALQRSVEFFDRHLAASQPAGSVDAIFIRDQMGYLNVGAELVILDLSDPARPTVVGRTALPPNETVAAITVFDQTAYVLADGLTIVDVSEPSQPVATGRYSLPARSPPPGPTTLTSPPPPPHRLLDVAVAAAERGQTIAYIAAGTAGLRLVDVSDPAAPVEVGELAFEPPAEAVAVEVDGGTAYLATGQGGLRVVDVAHPAQPEEIGSLAHYNESWDLAIDGDRLYQAEGFCSSLDGCVFGGVRGVNVADPANPESTGQADVGYSVGLALAGDRIYLATRYNLSLFQRDDLSQPIGTWPEATAFTITGLASQGDYLYLATGEGRLTILNTANPAAPTPVGQFP